MRRASTARSLSILCVALCIGLLSEPKVAALGPPNSVSASSSLPKYIDEYNIPTPSAAPLAISVDAKGVIWFTESNASKIGRFDPLNQSFREYLVPGVGDMWGITVDRAGYVWFTQYSGKGSVNPGGVVVGGGHGRLVRFSPVTGNMTIIDIPTVGSFPMRLVTDSRNRVWLTELLGNKIALYDPSTNLLTEYAVPSNSSGPADLVFDDFVGDLWFTEAYARQVGVFDSQSHEFTEYPLGASNAAQMVSSPVGIARASDGNLWITDHGGNWIVKFNPPSRSIIKYPTHFPPADIYPLSIPNGILVDGKGRVWFSEHGGNSIGYLDADSSQMVEFPIPTGPISTALWIALAPNDDVWFTEWETNKIGVVHANLQIPIVLRTSEHSLKLEAGGQTTLSLLTKVSQNVGGNGTFRYSWSSYNPKQVEVAFSPQYPSLAGLADTPAQTQLRLSPKTPAGNYTLSLGVDAGNIRVWAMLPTEVTPATSTGMTPIINQSLLIIGVVLVFAVVCGTVFRFRRRH